MSTPDKMCRLEAAEARVRQKRQLDMLSKRRLEAQELLYSKKQVEIKILSKITSQGESYSDLDIVDGITLARLTRDIFHHERELIEIRIYEAELHLDSLKDASSLAKSNWLDASEQVATILDACEEKQILLGPHTTPPLSPMHTPSLKLYEDDKINEHAAPFTEDATSDSGYQSQSDDDRAN